MKDIIEAWNDLPLLDREGDDIKLLEKKKKSGPRVLPCGKVLDKARFEYRGNGQNL